MAYDTNTEWEKIETKSFNLYKDLTILSGTIFGLSVALAVGRQGNIRFLTGELLLFISLLAGIIILRSHIMGKEWFHFMMTASELKFSLKKKNGGPEDFLVEAQEKIINDYDKLAEKSKGNFSSIIFKFIKIDYFDRVFLLAFVLGIFFIFFSLINTTGLEKLILSIKFH